ncbi:MAG: hypothetical protein ACK5C8_14095 [Roseiflexaceae bacterium]|jgi:hypothetical protein|nr:DinB family protein [Chloroflexaceae bacterium]MCE2852059.1 DinB family protein [Chloroflexaceae bacterium]
MTDQHHLVLHQMRVCREQLVETLQRNTAHTVVYAGTPAWCISDVLMHVAFWEVEGCKSLMAHAHHRHYATPNFHETDVDEINATAHAHLTLLPLATQLQYAADSRDAFMRALNALDAGALQREMYCPWAQYASVESFLTGMYTHEHDHLNDVLGVLKVSL